MRDVDGLFATFQGAGAIAPSNSPWAAPGDTPWGTCDAQPGTAPDAVLK